MILKSNMQNLISRAIRAYKDE